MVATGVVLSGRYRLEDELGSGGMSVVYRAADLRTGATVAVKVPHAFLLRDPTFAQRLQREVAVAAGLHSPRVATVIDFGEHEGTPYFVMEYVPGETLADMLTNVGALPPGEALRIALEVARALDVANERGVVHRDLKPGNIKLTRHGDVKVLDFGIARIEGTPGLTSASLLLGTPDYCAPERAEGAGDIRSDIYSLGVMLYEMLSGRPPFAGGTPWTTLQMHAASPLPPLPHGVPPVAAGIVSRCLAKRPEDRYQTPAALIEALQAAIGSLHRSAEAVAPVLRNGGADGGQRVATDAAPTVIQSDFVQAPSARVQTTAPATPAAARPAPAAPRRGRGPLIPLLAGAGVLAVAMAALIFVVLRRDSDDSPLVTDDSQVLTFLEPRDGAQVAGPLTVRLDIPGVNLKAPAEADPSGRHIHYFLDVDPATVLVPGQPIPTGQSNIVHTASATHTFVDLPPGPHTVWAVVTGNDHVPSRPMALGKVSVQSVPDPLVNARSGEAAPIVYQGLVDGKWRIFVMDGKGGSNRRLTGGNANDFNPAFSPDGSRIAFQSDRDGSHHIYTMNLDGSDVRPLTTGNSNNRIPSWSPDGQEIVFQSDRDGRDHLWAVPMTGGEPRQITRGPQSDGAPSIALDGGQIAYQSDAAGGTTHIFVVDRRGGTPKQLTDGPNRDNTPVWSPDGKRLAFASFRDNQWNIYVMNADGSNVKRLTDTSFNVKPSWSPDGKHLLFQSDREGGQQQIYVIPVEGGQARRLTQGPSINAAPSWPLK